MNGIIGVLQVKMDHLHSDDIIYGVRQRRKQTDPISCPVCGVTVRPADMEHHYAIEVDRLHKLQSPANRTAPKRVSCTQPKEPVVASTSSAPLVANSGSVGQACGEAGSSSASEVIDPKECWSTYQRIKNNRQARLKVFHIETADILQHIGLIFDLRFRPSRARGRSAIPPARYAMKPLPKTSILTLSSACAATRAHPEMAT